MLRAETPEQVTTNMLLTGPEAVRLQEEALRVRLQEQAQPVQVLVQTEKLAQGLDAKAADKVVPLANQPPRRGQIISDKSEQQAQVEAGLVKALPEQWDYEASKRAEKASSTERNAEVAKQQLAEHGKKVAGAQEELERLKKESSPEKAGVKPQPAAVAEPDRPAPRPAPPPPTPQPEISVQENPFSTFSLNVSDVSFKLAGASLENGAMPEPGSIRVEEFVNAFNYRDPTPAPGARLAFTWERARYPFGHNRDIVRFSIQTAARGREPGKPLNLVVLLDNSGSMERPDRVQIVHEALQVLARQLQPQDRISVVAFARTAHLWVDGLAGGNPQAFLEKVLDRNPHGGTNLEIALDLAYATAAKHFMASGNNRVILLTDGAANLGNVDPETLKQKVVMHRLKGMALDCFGIGWEGYNDDLLEVLSRHGDGRYGFLNSPQEAGPEFADQLAGALNVAAADVKAQVEFNPRRVITYRQIGYAQHQLTKEQFRDNTVDAAEIAAAESGNALYVVQVNPQGSGPLALVRIRYKVPATGQYLEQAWTIHYQMNVPALDQASPAMRLAVTAAAFGEWLARSPYASEVKLAALQSYLNGVPEVCAPDPRPERLAWMIRQAQSLGGK
jgi:Mg-chelatase subunit ChlD